VAKQGLGSRILIVEDDNGLRDVLARGLRADGFEVVTARDGESALRVELTSIDAVVLDIGLPDSDGRDVCQAIRSRGVDTPVLLLTARHAVGDRLSGFAVGADDYLAKPFAFAELVARLRVMLRRSGAREGVQWADLHVDPVSHALVNGADRIALSPTEFRLLARLLATPEAVVRRRQLVEAAWPAGGLVSDNTLDQYVSKLRRKIAQSGSPRTIHVTRGVGYRIG
jgi:two-component system response regulator MprA